MKPHELFDLTNRLMADLPPVLTLEELEAIGCSFVARAKFLKALKEPFMRSEILRLLTDAVAQDAPE